MHCRHDASQKEFPKVYLERISFRKMLLKGFKKKKKLTRLKGNQSK